MVRLTADVILKSPAFINPVKDRELDVRANKIPAIENLGVTQDQFDTIDISDNEIRRVENFPYLKRLKCIIMNNNKVSRVATGLGNNLPNLTSLILTNNKVEHLSEIDAISEFKQLETLSLLSNPVTDKDHYRLYVIHKIPTVRFLDFRKVKQKEREEAAKFFKAEAGKKLKASIATFTPGEPEEDEDADGDANMGQTAPAGRLSADQIEKIKAAIANADSLEEMSRLERALQMGVLPENLGNGATAMEED
eukprot:GFYU01007670.1.p1 GENE.GFYU01007670.1~~GFYU01007670.1.p1  ORF type:complete len:251 (-),score=63.76 GFYU01007670.1:325-1077(-)